MTGVTERVRAARERIVQRRADRPTKTERAQKRAEADARRREHKQRFGGGQDGGGGAG